MKKIYNVMASAAVIASLAIPASAFASSTYNTPTGVISTQANTVINTASAQRVAVTIAGGSLSNTPIPVAATVSGPVFAGTGTGVTAPKVSGTYNGAANATYVYTFNAGAWSLTKGGVGVASPDSGLTFTAPTGGTPVAGDTYTFTANAATTTPQTYSVNLRLPAGAATQFANPVVVPQYSSGTTLNAVGSATLTSVGTAHAAYGNNITTGYQEYTLTVTPATVPVGGVNPSMNDVGILYLDLQNTLVPSGVDAVNLTVDAPSNSPLTSGNVQIAQVGAGKVDATIDNVNSVAAGTNQALATLRIKESQAGSLATGNAVKVKLPSGFSWNNTGAASVVWGDARLAGVTLTATDSDKRTLYVKLPAGVNASNAATYLTISGLTVDVDDSVAKLGDIDATISGDSTYGESDLVVGHYGDYSTTVSVTNPANVKAGRADESLNDDSIKIQEASVGTLEPGRTIKLTLGANARWNAGDLPVIDQAASDLQGLQLGAFQVSANDPQTITASVLPNGASNGNKGATIVLKKGGLDLAGDAASQDVTLTVAGTAGVSGTGTIAKIVSPVTGKVSGDVANLEIGTQSQAIGDISLTEAVSGAFDNGAANKTVTLNFGAGVSPSVPTSVTVTDGDAVIDQTSINATGNVVTFNIKSTSSKPATVKISGVTLKLDRTVAQGPLKAKIQGSAINETGSNQGTSGGNNEFSATDNVGKVLVGNVVTSLDGTSSSSVTKFTIGKSTYNVNGADKTLDVAPYTEAGRTYLPIRFVANAVGVSDDNIVWNDATKTVTLIKGSRVVTFKVGENFYTLNGTQVSMDAAAQFKQNRNMIPLRYAAQALGVAISWDDATQTATVGQ